MTFLWRKKKAMSKKFQNLHLLAECIECCLWWQRYLQSVGWGRGGGGGENTKIVCGIPGFEASI